MASIETEPLELVEPRSSGRVIARPSEARSVRKRSYQTSDLTIVQGRPSRPGATGPPDQAGSRSTATLSVVGVVGGLGAAIAFGLLGLFEKADTLAGVFVAPCLAVAVATLIKRKVVPIAGEFVAAAVLAGFGLRLVGAVPRLLGGADANLYQREGLRIAESLRRLDLAVDTGRAVPGTGSVRYFSGVVNVFTLGNYVTTFLVFVTIAFVGQVLFLLAAQPALSRGQMRAATMLVMFSPTLVYWPSSIGKESLVLFGLGIGLFGVSKLYRREWSGLWLLISGGFAVGMVRPHMLVLLLTALLISLFTNNPGRERRLSVQAVIVVLLIAGAMIGNGASAQLFDLESFDGLNDVSAALDFTEERTSQDKAAFSASRVNSILDYPQAFVTVLFRPFIWEATGVPAKISAVESAGLIVLTLLAGARTISQSKSIFSRWQLLFSVAYTAVFVYVFSAVGNFGILSRQRAQVIPVVLLLIALGLGLERKKSRRVVT